MTGALLCLDITVSAGTVTFSSTGTLAIKGSMTLLAGTVWSATGVITFNATTTGKTVTTNGVSISGAISFNGAGGEWTLGSALTTPAAISVSAGTFNTSASNYNVTLSGRFTRNGSGTLNLNGSTLTLTGEGFAGGFVGIGGSGTVNAGTSQINFTNASVYFDTGSRNFYNVSFTSTTPGGCTVRGASTFNNITVAAKSVLGVSAVTFNANQTINGTLTLPVGTDATYRTLIAAEGVGTTCTLTCAAVSTLSDVDFRDITIAGAASPVSGTRLGNCKGNTNITFSAGVNKYWNLADGGAWGGAIAWATTSGGVPDINNFPLAQDNAIFEATGLNSGATVTFNSGYNINTIDMSARTSNTMTLSLIGTPQVYGDWTNGTGVTISGDFNINLLLAGRNTQNFTSAGFIFPISFNVASPGGTVILQDALTTSASSNFAFILRSGTLDLNGKTLSLTGLTAHFRTDAGTKNLTFNGGTLLLANVGSNSAFYNFSPAGFTTTAGTGTGTISLTNASGKIFRGAGTIFNCTINQGGAGTLFIDGSNTFTNITNTYNATGATSILFTAGTTNTFANWNANGAAGRLLTIGSSTAAQHTLSKASGTVNADFLSISRSTATGGATWNASNSIDGGNNTGWLFPGGAGSFIAFFM
jgi:hypothetical protein